MVKVLHVINHYLPIIIGGKKGKNQNTRLKLPFSYINEYRKKTDNFQRTHTDSGRQKTSAQNGLKSGKKCYSK